MTIIIVNRFTLIMPSATITAIREGNRREFTTEVWGQLPAHKYGWNIVADEPEEVTALKTGMVSQAQGVGSGADGEEAKPKRKKNAKSH